MKQSIEEVKEALVAYKATDIQQQGDKILATLTAEQVEADEEEIDTFSPFLSLCSYIACTQIKMRILSWIFESNCFTVELEVAE